MAYAVLTAEDFSILRENKNDIPVRQVVCVSDNQKGFVGMIYCQLQSWPFSHLLNKDKNLFTTIGT